MVGDMTRFSRIVCVALDRRGKKFSVDASGLFARCLQHEMDHLEGVLFLDHLSKLKRSIALRKLAKAKRLKDVG